MKLKKSDIETMLEVIDSLMWGFEEEQNPEFHKKVNDLESKLNDILIVSR